MKYLWTEDTGAGLHFWELVNQLFFDDAFVIESKGSNQGLLDALSDIDMKEDDKYYIAFDYVVDNQDIRNKYRILKSIADKAEGKIIILNMICFEYLILAFDKLVAWTGTGKTDKIKIREEVLNNTLENVEVHLVSIITYNENKKLEFDTETGIKNQIETIIAERYHLFDNNKIDIENNPILRRITYIVFPVWDLKGMVEEFQKMI